MITISKAEYKRIVSAIKKHKADNSLVLYNSSVQISYPIQQILPMSVGCPHKQHSK